MDEIRIELYPYDDGSERLTLSAHVGPNDITERLLNVRMIEFRPYLPSSIRMVYLRPSSQRARTLGRFLYDNNRDRGGVTPTILADALKAYVTAMVPLWFPTNETFISSTESDLVTAEQIAAAMSPMLYIGGKMWRLHPESHNDRPLKMLDALRTKTAEHINRSKVALLEQTNQQLAIVRVQVENERRRLDEERRELAEERRGQFIVPSWLRNRIIMRDGSDRLGVQLGLTMGITRFTWPQVGVARPDPEHLGRMVYSLASVSFQARGLDARARIIPPVETKYWLFFDPNTGAYVIENARIVEGATLLPHAHDGRFCCQPQGLPERITSVESLNQVGSAIRRTFQEVNMQSLLVRQSCWSGEISNFVPEAMVQYQGHDASAVPLTEEIIRGYGGTVTWAAEETNTLWHAENE